MTHSVDLEVFLAVDLELPGAFVVRVIQNVVTLGVPPKQVLILHTVCTNRAKPSKTSEDIWTWEAWIQTSSSSTNTRTSKHHPPWLLNPRAMGSRRPQGSASGSSGTDGRVTGMVSTLLNVPDPLEDWLLEVGPLEEPEPDWD